MKVRTLAPLSLLLAAGLASAALAQVKLEPKFTEGTRKVVNTVKVQQSLNLAGMDLATNVDVVTESTLTTGKPAEDGTVRRTEKIDAMKAKLDLPMGLKIDFDSTKPDQKPGIPQLDAIVETFRAMTGATYTYVYGKDRKVAAVEGLDKIIEAAPAGAAESLKSELSVESLKKEANQELERFPPSP
jgi:hypothetical protein